MHSTWPTAALLQDFSDYPRDANRLVYLAADLLAVLLHTLFIWALPMPLFVIVFGACALGWLR